MQRKNFEAITVDGAKVEHEGIVVVHRHHIVGCWDLIQRKKLEAKETSDETGFIEGACLNDNRNES